MKNNRSLFPPLFGEIPTGGGGGGSGNKIQLAELPEASLEYKDRIVQYIGATTEAFTNGYFYKCVEHTTTEGETITVTYSWDNVEVMEIPAPTQSGIIISETETKIGTYLGEDLYAKLIPNSGLRDIALESTGSDKLVTGLTYIKVLVSSLLIITRNDGFQLTASDLTLQKSAGNIIWTGYIRNNLTASIISDKKLILFYTKN